MVDHQETEVAPGSVSSPPPETAGPITGEMPTRAPEAPTQQDQPSASGVRTPPKRKLLRPALLAALAIVAIGGGVGAWWWTHRVVAAGLPTLYGNVDIREAQLAFEGSERITGISVQEGDKVKVGQVLATLDTRLLDAQMVAARAAIAAQQAALDKLNAGNRPEEIAEARATVVAAQADAAYAASEYARFTKLATSAGGGPATSQSQLDSVKSASDAAAAKVEVAQKALDLEIAGARKEDVAQAQAGLDQAKAQLAVLQQQESETKLVSPSDGVVLSRLAEPGEMAGPTRPVLSLAIVDPKWVRAYVSETDLGDIQPGMRATVTVDSFPGRQMTGWVGFVSPVAEFTPKTVETTELRTSLVYEVRVFVNDPSDQLRLGMPATVNLVPGQAGAGAK